MVPSSNWQALLILRTKSFSKPTLKFWAFQHLSQKIIGNKKKCLLFRGLFRVRSNIYDEAVWENSWQLSAIKYFCAKSSIIRCLIGQGPKYVSAFVKNSSVTLREKCPIRTFFLVCFTPHSRIHTDSSCKPLNSVRITENKGQKELQTKTFVMQCWVQNKNFNFWFQLAWISHA